MIGQTGRDWRQEEESFYCIWEMSGRKTFTGTINGSIVDLLLLLPCQSSSSNHQSNSYSYQRRKQLNNFTYLAGSRWETQVCRRVLVQEKPVTRLVEAKLFHQKVSIYLFFSGFRFLMLMQWNAKYSSNKVLFLSVLSCLFKKIDKNIFNWYNICSSERSEES